MNKLYQSFPEEFRYGYARVSSKSQEFNSSLESQKQELIDCGVPEENIRIEIDSAADSFENRPVFNKLIEEELKKDTLLIVTKIDRCSRNTLSFLKLQETLSRKGVAFIALDLPHSDDMAVNKLILTQLAAIATFEYERRRERQRIGIEAAKAKGKYKGRKSVITPKIVAQVKDLKENKQLSISDIAKVTGIGRSTVYKVLKTKLGYVSNQLVKPHNDQNTQKKD